MNEPTIYCRYSELKPTDSLLGHPLNALTHPEAQVRALARIITLSGWRAPIVVSKRSGYIVKGHGRLMAAKFAGFKECPVELQDYENEAAEYADLVADNRIAELAEWDNKTLAEVLSELQKNGASVGEITGFTLDEVTALMAQAKGEIMLPAKATGKDFDESVAGDVDAITCPYCNKIFAK